MTNYSKRFYNLHGPLAQSHKQQFSLFSRYWLTPIQYYLSGLFGFGKAPFQTCWIWVAFPGLASPISSLLNSISLIYTSDFYHFSLKLQCQSVFICRLRVAAIFSPACHRSPEQPRNEGMQYFYDDDDYFGELWRKFVQTSEMIDIGMIAMLSYQKMIKTDSHCLLLKHRLQNLAGLFIYRLVQGFFIARGIVHQVFKKGKNSSFYCQLS